ncbi:MAG: DUF1080 domain-containing protein [Bryobacteraceae bacterium]|nr:DUF1080 domain-containing protein [Bryobacteraceae bacterium]MDW8378439.1 DUF1080 domain-containing protein [Bryobacterales bacterium]
MLPILVLPFLSWQLVGQIPVGFTPIFNRKDLTGWHISQVNHHGNTKAWSAQDGVLMVTQDPPGNGGILLTDRKYRNFEVYLEINPDFGCDGGLFLRSTEKGEAYQVMIDYLEGGSVGGIYGERLQGIGPNTGKGDKSGAKWKEYWRTGAWNSIRARIEGDIPHIQVWLNGFQIVDWTDDANHSPNQATEGMIALQAHRSNPQAKNSRWVPGGYHRFRNIAVKVLP